MVKFVLEAFGLGLCLAFLWGFGPAFFALVQTSINKGFRAAAWFAIGVFLNDVLVVALCALTSTSINITVTENKLLFHLGAGLILILFGFFTFFKKTSDDNFKKAKKNNKIVIDNHKASKRKKPFWIVYLGKGFVLNVLNPSVWVFWLGTVMATSEKLSGDLSLIFLFFAIVLCTSLSCDFLKAKGASWLKRFFNTKRLNIMNKIIGCCLFLFGLFFIITGLI